MKVFQVTILFFLLISFSDVIFAQQLKEDQVVLIQGKKYLLHQVHTGETIYSITRNYKVDSTMLVQNNPSIKNGLKIGDILRIPYRENIDIQQEPIYKKGDPTYFDTHVIESRKETPYFIAKEYGITVEELYAYNPGVNRFKKGVTVKIPVWEPKSEKKEKPVTGDINTGTNNQGIQNNSSEIQKPVLNNSGIANYFEHTIESGETMWGITH